LTAKGGTNSGRDGRPGIGRCGVNVASIDNSASPASQACASAITPIAFTTGSISASQYNAAARSSFGAVTKSWFDGAFMRAAVK